MYELLAFLLSERDRPSDSCSKDCPGEEDEAWQILARTCLLPRCYILPIPLKHVTSLTVCSVTYSFIVLEPRLTLRDPTCDFPHQLLCLRWSGLTCWSIRHLVHLHPVQHHPMPASLHCCSITVQGFGFFLKVKSILIICFV